MSVNSDINMVNLTNFITNSKIPIIARPNFGAHWCTDFELAAQLAFDAATPALNMDFIYITGT